MNKLTLTALLILPATTIFAQSGTFSIKGTVPNAGSQAKAFLLYSSDGNNITDSTAVVNGGFEFKGTVATPTMGSLLIGHSGQTFGELRRSRKVDVLSMYIEPGNTQVTGVDSVKKAKIIGSKLNDENQRLIAELKPFNDKLTALYAEERAVPKDKQTDELSAAFDKRENAIDADKKVVYTKFIKANPASYVSLNSLQGAVGYYPEASDLEPLLNVLSPELKATKQGKAYAEMIPKLRMVALGAQAPEFAQNDKDGKSIALSSFRGKYVLIDFWAGRD